MDKFDSAQKKDYKSEFGKLMFSWMAASLLHDIGYDIEKSYEEEKLRRQKNQFWNFMMERPVADSPIGFNLNVETKEIIKLYLLDNINKVKGMEELTIINFQDYFKIKINGEAVDFSYDHGVISAIKYIMELKKLEKENGGEYLNWEPNKKASLAMALHNFRHRKSNIKISSEIDDTMLAYLLIICDEVQEWERDRYDYDIRPDAIDLQRKDMKLKTELTGVTFKDKYAYIIINHKLKKHERKNEFQKDLIDKRFTGLKRDFPINLMFPYTNKRTITEIRIGEPSKYKDLTQIKNNPIWFEITEEKLNEHSVLFEKSDNTLMYLYQVARTSTEKKFLVPSEDSFYKVYVEHRIDNEPFITIEFPF